MDLKLIKSKDINEHKNDLKSIKKDNAKLQEEWLNSEEAAKYLRVSIRTLKRYRDAGKLAYSKDSRMIRYKKTDLIDYINNHYHKTE